MGKNSWERANDGSANLQRRAKQSSKDFKRAAEISHSTFESSTESSLGSGKSQAKEPAQAEAGSLDPTMIAMIGTITTLGAMAAATIIRRNRF